MTDVNIINNLENKLKIKLGTFSTGRNSRGFKLDSNGEKITHLSISDYQITNHQHFISSIKKLESLTSLNLSYTFIKDISFLKNLSSLRELYLENCKIKNITDLADLKALEILNLTGNNIQDISSLIHLAKLTHLYLKDNEITDISPITFLKELTDLNLSYNHIKDISPVALLRKITGLDLQKNNIDTIEPLQDLTTLLKLDLAHNSVSNVIPLKNLKKLTFLSLTRNKITDLGPLSDLIKITDLFLGVNQISVLDPLKKFKNISRLILYENSIKDISALSELKQLNALNLSDNYIKDISPLQSLKELTWLPLANNLIKDMAPLKELRNLQQLDLKNNPVNKLPIWITDFNLDIIWQDALTGKNGAISFFNNPLDYPPIEIVKQGKNAIQRFFENIEKEGTDYIYEAKLTLVGEGNAGKTSLKCRLLNSKSALPKKDKRTRGIKIYNWCIKKNKNNNHTAHIWDFGGQDVYYPVHRFFLTENSVFVLLASTRQTHHNFDYWIPTIYQFGGKSPIILGQTCHDGNKVPWNDLGYYLGNPYFNIIKTQELPYHEINLPKKNDGLSKLKKSIVDQIINLPHYGKGVPTSWVKVRDILFEESKKIDCITFERFKDICKQSKLNGFANLVDIVDCGKFFHSIGVILWYYDNEELRNWVVLQPEWAMNAVYKIIDDEDIQKRSGNISAKDFKRLWVEQRYEDKHTILKKMLEVFKIAFPKKDKKEDYIIPARLTSMPIEEKWKDNNPFLRIEYKYEFMPKGMVNQLSAELSRYIISNDQVWNNAVNFSNQNNTAQCQVEEDFYNRKINIKAKGKDARGLIMLVMNSLKDISDEYKGVQPTIYVPCICNICKSSSSPTIFSYEKLLKWSLNKENPRVTCNESDNSIPIEILLYNVGLPNNTKENTEQGFGKKIKIFLASSSELKRDREIFEMFINRENKRLNNEGIFLELNMWEDFVDNLSKTRLQDEYNRIASECDIFISLFFTKVGKYTSEEFERAFGQFKDTGKPLVYTYFKDEPQSLNQVKKEDIDSKFFFEEKLRLLGHFKSIYRNTDDLKYQFKMQLEKILNTL
jgi:Leucine-rich repeat (LRR) protein